MSRPSPTPRELGFRMPVERARHAATWTTWPADDVLWEGQLEPARDDMTAMVAAIARFEPVVVNVRDAEARTDAETRLRQAGVPNEAVRFHPVPSNDVWLRDNGPLFVVGNDGKLALTDWRFDGWAGKYASDLDDRVPAEIAAALGVRRFAFDEVLEGGAIEMGDDGTVLTTRSCLLDGVRNRGMDEIGYTSLMRDGLGATRIVWLVGGLVDDHTDGHVDTVVRFAAEDTIVCVRPDADDTENLASLRANRATLEALRRVDGSAYRIVDLPLPSDRSRLNGVRPPRSYANFCLVNGGVIVPTYDDPRDAEALEILRGVFTEREVVGVPATGLITGGGAFHCATQHQPEAETPS
ncbi:MAG: agmatine deiminase family protein [Trueperaceae bacterium]|nr:agmatine deiminase family protein [Trueperaceae bacterium]